MHPQLASVIQELDSARDRLHALAGTIGEADWNRRPQPDRWSPAECVAHLALTAQAFLPLIDEALGRAYSRGSGVKRRLRRSIAGWLIWRGMGPPARFRSKTASRFVPSSAIPKAESVQRLDELNDELADRVRRADGYPIDRVRLVSPFNRRVKYDVYSAFTILVRHEHRHLWQAEQARESLKTVAEGSSTARAAAAR